MVAALSAAGTATLFATVIMPLSNTLLTNKIEKLTELSAGAANTAGELEKVKKELAASRADERLAVMKSPFIPGSVYPLGLDSVIIGTPAQEILTRLPGAKWDEDNQYITYDVTDENAVFSQAAYYFDKNRKVSAILYQFRDREAGAELVKKLMLTGFGEPYAQKKHKTLWKINDHEWATLEEYTPGNITFHLYLYPLFTDWGAIPQAVASSGQ